MAIETGLGVQHTLRLGVSGSAPISYAETPGGLLLLANGIDPMLKWDGLSGHADTAGVAAPTTAMELGGTELGTITGRLVAYQRFVDADGNVSDLSPVSNTMDAGHDVLIEDVNYVRETGVASVRAAEHGLVTGDTVLITEVEGIPLINGTRTVTVVNSFSFTIDDLAIIDGAYEKGGVITLGITNVIYGGVPVPAERKVVRRQILRNLAGNADVLYVDVDTTNLTATAFASTSDDETLARGEAVPLNYGDGDLDFANRHGVPPSHKRVVVQHKGRIFAAADGVYSAGHVEPAFNSTQVTGVQTEWRQSFAGRLLYVAGAVNAYQIASVDEDAQVITLSSAYREAPVPYALYSIRPEEGERRLVYYSEPGLPESWPAYNAFAVPECGDEIVGLLSRGQYLYVIGKRHVHRVTFRDEPADGMVWLSCERGAVNDRCYTPTEVGVFLLDEAGVHKFDGADVGEDTVPISTPIQNVFQNDGVSDVAVDWDSDQSLWHCAHDPVRTTLRWFVTMVGYDWPYHAIGYDYRSDRWWIEQYPTAMTSSACMTLGGRRSLAGTTDRRIVCLSEGSYDGVKDVGTLRGSPTAITSTTLTDTSAGFQALEGAPISIVDGPGWPQQRIVAFNTATSIEVVEPWDSDNLPTVDSVYQVGGIAWSWRSGWFRFMDGETEDPRDVEVVFQPLADAANLDIQLYYDHAAGPRAWSRTITQDGVRTVEGSPKITVDLDTGRGWARQRGAGHADQYSHGDRFVSVALSGVQGGEAVRVSQVILTGVEIE